MRYGITLLSASPSEVIILFLPQPVKAGTQFSAECPHILESTLIFPPKFKALKVLEKSTGARKSLNFIP